MGLGMVNNLANILIISFTKKFYPVYSIKSYQLTDISILLRSFQLQ